MKVSVIVPTYERTDKLERALRSVQNQEFDDLELIVVDDNKSKKYRKKVGEITQKISQDSDFLIRKLVNEEKQGVSSARNLGIDEASGKYIAFLDDDDEWKPKKIDKQIEKIKEEDVNAVYTASEMYNDEVKDIVRKAPNLNLNSLLERDRIGSPSKVMVETEWLKKIEGFDEEIPSGEDWDIWIRLIQEGCNFAYIDEPLTRYHKDESSKSKQKDVATEGREMLTQKHLGLLEEAGDKIKATHHLNRAKKQYQLGDNTGTREHLKKTLTNNPIEPEAYVLLAIYVVKAITGIDIMPRAAEIKGKLK